MNANALIDAIYCGVGGLMLFRLVTQGEFLFFAALTQILSKICFFGAK